MSNLQFIKIEQLHHHPDNPRKDLGDVTELAESIKAKGVLQNLTVVPWSTAFRDDECPEALAHAREYAVVIGNRRLEAGRLAGVEELPCIVSDMRYHEQISTMMVENVQRADLTIYEQAQGFQMMLDLGDTVDAISEKTGFSKRTVKGRLEIAKLDLKKLHKVEQERQITLREVEDLSKVEDLKHRNNLIELLGTRDFDFRLQSAIRVEQNVRAMPKIKELIKRLGIKTLAEKDRYSSRYEPFTRFQARDFNEETAANIEKKTQDGQVYWIGGSTEMISMYTQRKKAEPTKKSKKELEKERRLAEAHAKAAQLTELAFDLRKEFIKGLVVNQKNMEQVLMGAVLAGAISKISYTHVVSDDLLAAAGYDGKASSYTSKKIEAFASALKEGGTKHIPEIIQTLFGDGQKNGYHTVYKWDFPEHSNNVELDALYSWLCSLGYQMSSDELAMQDGTHEVFRQGKKGENG